MDGGASPRLIDTFDQRTINNALSQIIDGSAFDRDFRDAVRELGEDPPRDDLKTFVQQNEELGASLLEIIGKAKQKSILRQLEEQLYYIEGEGEDIDDISTNLTLTQTEYYQSYFNFAGKSFSILKTDFEDGIFARIASEAETQEQAKNIYRSYIQESDIDDLYIDATRDVPAPLIGEIDYTPKPRLIHFEDDGHIYFEYWTKSGQRSYFDVNKGDYVTVERRGKTAVRVHINTGIIEYVSTKGSESHRRGLIDKLIERFWMDDDVETDGGVPSLVAGVANLHTDINIQNDDISQVKENLGILSTLDGFRGGIANVRFSSRNNSDVGRDPDHQHIEDNRDLRISHPNIFLGEDNGDIEIIEKKQIEAVLSITPEMSVDEILEEFQENSSYSKVHRFTIVMNSDRNTIRVWKRNYSPSTRLKLIHLIQEELDW